MQNKFGFIVLLILFLFTYISVSGQSDTVYIYEEIVVYDTVYVYDTIFVNPSVKELFPIKPKVISVLQLDTVNLNASLLLISNQQTATFPINHIILIENVNRNIKKSESMKKLSFFGVVLFAFQTMVLAQPSYEMSLGTGTWWQSGKLDYVDKPFSTLLNVGLFTKRNFRDKNFGLKTGIDYNYLLGSNEYKFDGTIGVWHTQTGYEFEYINRNYGAGLHNISIPFLLYYHKYKVQPFIGLNYNYLTTNQQTSPAGTKFYGVSHNLGLNIGTGFKLYDLYSVNLEFNHNFTPDYEQGSRNFYGPTVFGESFYLRNNQLRISFVYNFKKKTT